MARFSNGNYYLFAVLAILAVFANALPAQNPPDDMAANMGDSVAGVPGLGNPMHKPQQAPDIGDDFTDAFSEASSSAMAMPSATAHPTPNAAPTPISTPKASPMPAKNDNNPLSGLPVIGGLLGKVPLLGGK